MCTQNFIFARSPLLIGVVVGWGVNSPQSVFFFRNETKVQDLYRKVMFTKSHLSWGWVEFN